jgi:hypothetical protein
MDLNILLEPHKWFDGIDEQANAENKPLVQGSPAHTAISSAISSTPATPRTKSEVDLTILLEPHKWFQTPLTEDNTVDASVFSSASSSTKSSQGENSRPTFDEAQSLHQEKVNYFR